MGGYPTCKNTYEVIIDTNSKSVTPKCDMIVAKYWHSLCKYDQSIYSIGGRDGSKALNDCEKYDTKSGQWVKLPDLLQARQDCAALNFKNEWVYALCGDDGAALNKVERLKIQNVEKWENVVVDGLM